MDSRLLDGDKITTPRKPGRSRKPSAGGKTLTARKAAKKAAKKKTVVKKSAVKKPVARKATRKTVAGKATRKTVAGKATRKTAAGKATGTGSKKTARAASPKKAAASGPARKKVTKKVTRKVTKKVARSAPPRRTAPPTPPPPPVVPARSAEDYRKALEAYSRCMELLQKKDWDAASRGLIDFKDTFPAERELHERARMYLRVCAQHLDSEAMNPQSFADRFYMAVVLSNQGDYKRALVFLEDALAERPGSIKASYLKASTLALAGRRKEALKALERAIALDESNRIFAANDPDFSSLRDDEEFITLTTQEDEEY